MAQVLFSVDYSSGSPVVQDSWSEIIDAWYWQLPNNGITYTELARERPDRAFTEPDWEFKPVFTDLCPKSNCWYHWWHPTHGWQNVVEDYSHLTLLNNRIVDVQLQSGCDLEQDNGRWACSGSSSGWDAVPCDSNNDGDWAGIGDTGSTTPGAGASGSKEGRNIFPDMDIPAISNYAGGDDSLLTLSINNYTPMAPQEWWDKSTYMNQAEYCTDGSLSTRSPLIYPTAASVRKPTVHWLSDTQEIQEGYFALNIANACNGRVNFVSDNKSYFASGTFIYQVESWVESSTYNCTTPSYLGLRGSSSHQMDITKIGAVKYSKVYANTADHEIDYEEMDVTYSKLGLGGDIKVPATSSQEWWAKDTSVELRDVTTTPIASLDKSCLTTECDIETYKLSILNSTLTVTNFVNSSLDAHSSITNLSITYVDLKLINYTAANLTVASDHRINLTVGSDYLFNEFDIDMVIQAIDGAFNVTFANNIYSTIPSKIILTGFELPTPGPTDWEKMKTVNYAVSGVDFNSAGTDPHQSWNGTEVTYTIQLANLELKDLKPYGIPTGELKFTTLDNLGRTNLKERVSTVSDYKELFGMVGGQSTEHNNAAALNYNPEDIDDRNLPRCDR